MTDLERTSQRARLAGGLIVSVQADAESVLNTPATIALLAQCAIDNGAAGVRIEGAARIAAVRARLETTPIIGIVKREHAGFAPYITATRAEIDEVADAGATIVAFDATGGPYADGSTLRDLIAAAHARGLCAMADCSNRTDVAAAADGGADIVATTLAGYTAQTRGRELPALDLVRFACGVHDFTMCEGGIATPALAGRAFAAGASAIVVGTAITNVDALVRSFVAASVITGHAPGAV